MSHIIINVRVIRCIYNIYMQNCKSRVHVEQVRYMRRIGIFYLITSDYAVIDNQTSHEILFVRNFVISRMSHGSVSGPLIVRNFIQFNYLAVALKPNEALNRPY